MTTETNLIKAANNTFKVYEGDTTPAVLTFTDTDSELPKSFSGSTVVMKIKNKQSDTDAADTFSTTSGDIVVSGDGSNVLTISGFDRLTAGNYVYDLQESNSGTITTWLKGKIRVTQDA